MTPGDIARLLALLAAYDQRTVGETDVAAWLLIIGDLEVDRAQAAVVDYERNRRVALGRRMIPGDVIAYVRANPLPNPAPEAIPDADPDDIPGYLAAIRDRRYRSDKPGEFNLPQLLARVGTSPGAMFGGTP